MVACGLKDVNHQPKCNKVANTSSTLTEGEEWLVGLLCAVLADAGSKLSISFERDISVVQSRTRAEGFAFCTKTLPLFGKTILNGLRTGVLSIPGDFPFKRKARGAIHPAFLQDITSGIFASDGKVLENAKPACVRLVEQICFLFYKYELEYEEGSVKTAFEKLAAVNESLPPTYSELISTDDSGEVPLIIEVASQLLGDVFGDYDAAAIVPRHGSGSTAEGKLEPYEKYDFRPFPPSLERVYNRQEWCEASPSVNGMAIMRLSHFWGQSVLMSPMSSKSKESHFPTVARLVAVPKNADGPRTISAEPKELMWFQQGIWRYMRGAIQNHVLTRGHVNFDDQEVNRGLALESSLSGEYATLDLSAASDRVSLALVYMVFPRKLLDSLLATRSTHWTFPESADIKGLVELKTFAPMGSAVCFPVESILFWALCVGILVRIHEMDIKEAAGQTFIYGDDIIIPSYAAHDVMRFLEKFHFKVNESKSYVNSFYRESCGMNAFRGECVTPIRIKKLMPLRREQSTRIVAWVSYANALNEKGFSLAFDYIRKYIEREVLGHRLPIVPRYSEAIGWFSDQYLFDPNDGWRELRAEDERRLKKFALLADGSVWVKFNPKPFFGQGVYYRKCLTQVVKTIEPDFHDFSDERAYLRYFTEHIGEGEWTGARLFTLPDSTTLKWKRVYVS